MATLEENAQGGDKHAITIFTAVICHNRNPFHKRHTHLPFTPAVYYTVLYLLIIQESIAGNTAIKYRTCPKHISF